MVHLRLLLLRRDLLIGFHVMLMRTPIPHVNATTKGADLEFDYGSEGRVHADNRKWWRVKVFI